MTSLDFTKTLITDAFGAVPYPGDNELRGSNEGDEPFRVEADFRGKKDWSALSSEFIDQSPDGLGSALSFFSDAAFRFYIAAYMIADLDEKLNRSNPLFHLTYGLDETSKSEHINPERYGTMTWFDRATMRFANFDPMQRSAVAAYLSSKKSSEQLLDEEIENIDQALECFWSPSST